MAGAEVGGAEKKMPKCIYGGGRIILMVDELSLLGAEVSKRGRNGRGRSKRCKKVNLIRGSSFDKWRSVL